MVCTMCTAGSISRISSPWILVSTLVASHHKNPQIWAAHVCPNGEERGERANVSAPRNGEARQNQNWQHLEPVNSSTARAVTDWRLAIGYSKYSNTSTYIRRPRPMQGGARKGKNLMQATQTMQAMRAATTTTTTMKSATTMPMPTPQHGPT